MKWLVVAEWDRATRSMLDGHDRLLSVIGSRVEGGFMPRTFTIETTLAAWSLVGGILANIAGFMLIGRLAWPLSALLIALGTSGLVGAMVLVAMADRRHRIAAAAPTSGTD
jgi:hypothetical protein